MFTLSNVLLYTSNCQDIAEIALAKNLIHQHPQMVLFVVVNGHENHAVVGQQFAEQLQAGPHHAEPLVVTLQILAVNGLVQPFAHQGAVHLVVVGPALVAGVVGRVDVDALDAASVAGQQGFERVEIVAVNDQVIVGG